MSRIKLLFGVHAHQPVGNFGTVIDDAHVKCYRPFLHTLARYPAFRFAAHFSGWLLARLEHDYPEDMAVLGEMVARGQVEMVGGGFAEPVLAAIPHRDRCTQLHAMSAHLQSQYGQAPTGAWLTERVWESTIVPALLASGLKYVTVDDYHFLCTGAEPAALDGFYTTEEEGSRLDLFPIAEGLRYRLPFAPAADAVAYLETLAQRGDAAAIYFDDIEKFGIWPETYDWVYTKGWLVEFVERVLTSSAIETSTYADFHHQHHTRGLVYLPTTSYSEMNQWTLPAPAAARYATLVQRVTDAGHLVVERPFLRGGIWRNFLSRYAEANWMHKRMLELSARLLHAEGDSPSATLQTCLHNAQANDAYWHGLFGGLYLPHLRRAVWHNLLRLDAALGAPRLPLPPDFDCDGQREFFLRDAGQLTALRDDGTGTLHEWSSLSLCHNFGDTLRRYAEHYHVAVLNPPVTEEKDETGIASAHHRVAFRHDFPITDLSPDLHGRGLFEDFLLTTEGAYARVETYVIIQSSLQGLTLEMAPNASGSGMRKRYELTSGELRVTWYPTGDPVGWATALHLALPSCDGYGGRYRLADLTIPGGFGQPLQVQSLKKLWLEDSALGGRIQLTVSHPVQLRAAPFHTVSQSEAGFEQIMQAARLELRWENTQPLEIILRIEATAPVDSR